jgi:hypothetical protein
MFLCKSAQVEERKEVGESLLGDEWKKGAQPIENKGWSFERVCEFVLQECEIGSRVGSRTD